MRCVRLIKVGVYFAFGLDIETSMPTFCYAAVEKAINESSITDKAAAHKSYLSAVAGKSNNEAREIAADVLGESVFWDWDRKSRMLFYYSKLTM